MSHAQRTGVNGLHYGHKSIPTFICLVDSHSRHNMTDPHISDPPYLPLRHITLQQLLPDTHQRSLTPQADLLRTWRASARRLSPGPGLRILWPYPWYLLREVARRQHSFKFGVREAAAHDCAFDLWGGVGREVGCYGLDGVTSMDDCGRRRCCQLVIDRDRGTYSEETEQKGNLSESTRGITRQR